MLEFIREKMRGLFATVIVGFFCAVFALWGVESLFNASARQKAVATVNGNDISEFELADAIQIMRQRYMKMLGNQVDAGFLNDKMLREPALDALIGRKVLQDQIEKLDMAVGIATVDKAIVRDPVFSRDGKRFDPDYYKEQLRNAGLSAVAYQGQMKQQLVLNQLQHGIGGSAFATDVGIADAARLMAQKRSYEYLRFPLQDAMSAVVVAEADAEKYYQDHKNDFLSEEQVVIEYIELDKQALAKDVVVEESDIRASYDSEVASFKPVAERQAAHILVEARDDGSEKTILDQIAKRLASGESFAVLAKEFSRDEGSAAQGGDVGFTSGDTFVPEFENALAALQNEGDVSPPVKTEFGFHIIKLLKKRETALPPYEKRKPEIEQQLKQAKAATVFSEKLDQLSELTYSAGDLAGPAAELGLPVQKSGSFGRRGGAGVAGQQKVIDTAFSSELLDSGKNSQVIELSAEKALVLRVAGHELPKVKDYAQVKNEISDKLKRERAVTALRQKVEALKQRAAAGETLTAISKEEQQKLVVVESRNRSAKTEVPQLLSAAFKLPKPVSGSATLDVIELDNGDQVLLSLTSVEDVAVAKGSPDYQAASQRVQDSVSAAEFSLFEQQLRSAAKIERKNEQSKEGQEGK